MAISRNIPTISEGSERLNSVVSGQPIAMKTSEQRTHCPGVKVGEGDGEEHSLCRWEDTASASLGTDKTIPHRKLP